MNTPWGKSDSKTTVTRGISFVGTPSHGGFAVTPSAALKFLSTSAVSRALKYGSYYFFEEDCDYAIVMLELLEKAKSLLAVLGTIPTRESLIASLSRWHADYLVERNIQPNPEGVAWFNANRQQDRMRADKSPDLIVAAFGSWAEWVPNDMVGVITADDKKHLVWEKEYTNSQPINLLSNYTNVEAVL